MQECCRQKKGEKKEEGGSRQTGVELMIPTLLPLLYVYTVAFSRYKHRSSRAGSFSFLVFRVAPTLFRAGARRYLFAKGEGVGGCRVTQAPHKPLYLPRRSLRTLRVSETQARLFPK